ncbi:putative iron-sulfur cluster co-chaperone protein HscB mitochondrial [Scophthalmus maximus]|uniref:Putative iron-sulfur cluster co-chaperone protein HscB mitochondrial n=1 Tax=Scophthalmus maximus TaxID=52904 RepID=A0A2U9BTQ0_SCOMX|nr:putative iron-sulfur cluster co-chaperone protein HscB mitochondrial [Scophthalmus maximus]
MGSRGAPVRGRGPTLHAHQSNSPRNFCTGPVGHNCWKCEQPLDTAPAFFCVSCKVVQPPEEGVSYFKIMACSLHTEDTSWHGRSMGSRGAPVRGRGPTLHAHQSNSPRNFCTGPVGHNCWKCEQPLDTAPAFFCVSCKVVQPPEEGVSYFKIMACDHTFTLDTHQLQKRYLQLQRSLHPDNFSQNSVREQEYSENQSALVNKAYTTLLKPLSRGLYMLELEGVRIEEGKKCRAATINRLHLPNSSNSSPLHFAGKLADLTERIDAALRTGELQTARALLAQMKYHANIEEKVKEKLREFM